MRLLSGIHFLWSGILVFAACQDQLQRDQIHRIYVYQEINLNDFRYNNLNIIGGYVYHEAGVRGIILYRKSMSQILAFERDCPFQPSDACALVSVDLSGLFMIDTCCTSRFDFDGNPIAGPVQFPLLQYKTYQNQNYLIISSD